MAHLTQEDMKKDFKLFLYFIWKKLDLPKPTKVQLWIADALQHGQSRLIIEAFRGIGKSYITAAFSVWLLWKDPDIKVMVVSASQYKATEVSNFAKNLLYLVPFLEHLIPRDRKKRTSVLAFDVQPCRPAQAPSYRAVGITGQITGGRADVIIGDDVEVPKNSYTAELRQKLFSAVGEFEALLTTKDSSRIIYLGTPQTEDTIYNKLLMLGVYDCKVYPSEYPDKDTDRHNTWRGCLAPEIEAEIKAQGIEVLAGKPTDPERFSAELLMERKLGWGKSGYRLHFMLDSSLSDLNKYPLRLSDLIVTTFGSDKAPLVVNWSNSSTNKITEVPQIGMGTDSFYKPSYVASMDNQGDWASYQEKIMHIDPSGKGFDETAAVILGSLYGRLYLIDIVGIQGEGYSDNALIQLAEAAKYNKVHKVIIEANFGGGMFTQLFKPVLRGIYPDCTVSEVTCNRQKEVRVIETLEPLMNQHKLVVNLEVVEKDLRPVETFMLREIAPHSEEEAKHNPQNYSLFYQLTRITKDKGSLIHDDRLDALAGACEYFLKQMSQDTSKAKQLNESKLLDIELKKFKEAYTKDSSKRQVDYTGVTSKRYWGNRKI